MPEQNEIPILPLQSDVAHVVQVLKPRLAAYHPCFRLQTQNGPPSIPVFIVVIEVKV
jgi:hypothetical protein